MMWRGRLFGATSTTSKRMSQSASSGWLASQASAAAMMRRCWRTITASAASSSRSRAFTSTKIERAAPPRHDVDLADRAAPAPRHDAMALGDQIGGGAAFRREAERERDLALRRGASGASGGHVRRGHRRPSSVRARGCRPRGAARRSRPRLRRPHPSARRARARRAAAHRSRSAPDGCRRIRRRDHDRRSRRASRRPPHNRARARRASPRRTSSCSLVSSRAIAASRRPSPSARSASVAASRGPLSNSTSVAGMRASSAMRVRRARGFRRQESLEEEPVGRQPRDRQRHQRRGGPGAAVTGCPAAVAARTSL